MIELENMTKSFGEHILFHNYNLTIQDGEFVAFTGKSGCGKSTILNIIGGLEKPDTGSVRVDGLDIYKRKYQKAYFSDKVNFLFQNFALIEGKTVRENLNIIPKNHRENRTMKDVLESVGLLSKIDTKVYKLSGGEQQRVALARCMLKKCILILADEPTGSLDLENAQVVIDALRALNRKGKTVILVTHDLHSIPKEARVINL